MMPLTTNNEYELSNLLGVIEDEVCKLQTRFTKKADQRVEDLNLVANKKYHYDKDGGIENAISYRDALLGAVETEFGLVFRDGLVNVFEEINNEEKEA